MDNADQPISTETKWWAVPDDGVSLDDLTLALTKAGTPVLERDEKNNRLLVGYDLAGPPTPPLHVYDDETCCVSGCKAKANHLISDATYWCDLHLVGIRSLLEKNPGAEPHALAKEAWG